MLYYMYRFLEESHSYKTRDFLKSPIPIKLGENQAVWDIHFDEMAGQIRFPDRLTANMAA